VALGATIIEKHFTLDRSRPGPDHCASLEPQDLRRLVSEIRTVEEALGSARKEVTASEAKNRPIARRSLVALRPIRAGEPFTESNLGAKRPGSGVSPMGYWNYLGKIAHRDYRQDEGIEP
jgi:sialic acid synthase SpsE